MDAGEAGCGVLLLAMFALALYGGYVMWRDHSDDRDAWAQCSSGGKVVFEGSIKSRSVGFRSTTMQTADNREVSVDGSATCVFSAQISSK